MPQQPPCSAAPLHVAAHAAVRAGRRGTASPRPPPRAPQAVDPTTFQLLSQMKTIFTGLLFRVFLGRHLSGAQYLALVTLACGTATSQIPSAAHPLGHASVHGLILSLVSCALSAFGGIYSEKLLKKRPSASIHWQNMQLYAWGVAFNALGFAIKDGGSLANGWSTGYESGWAWAVVLCNACNGLAISAVLKFADNIARVYAHAIAMVATMLVSVRLFAAPITPLSLAISSYLSLTRCASSPRRSRRSSSSPSCSWAPPPSSTTCPSPRCSASGTPSVPRMRRASSSCQARRRWSVPTRRRRRTSTAAGPCCG